MTSQDISLALEERTIIGKGLSNLRSTGRVPAVIHDHGKDSIHVSADFIAITKAFANAGKHHPVNLTIGSSKHLALIKDVDFEPTKHTVRHVVFQAIKQNEAVEAEIPIVFKADAEIPAERASLLVLKQLDHVQVKALPKDLPDELVVDPSSLTVTGDHLTVADLIIPAGVTLLTELEQQIAIVETPRDQIAEANASAEALAEDAGTTEVDATEATEAKADDKDKSEEE